MRLAPLAVTVALAVAACSDSEEGTPPSAAPTTSTTTPSTAVFPGQEWEQRDPTEAGFDVAALESLEAAAEAGGSSCLFVAKDGRVILDRSWPGPTAEPREVFSVTKSFTGLLVGAAATQGELDRADRVADYVEEWAGTPSAEVTVDHLLSGTSGRHWDAATDYRDMALGAEDKTAFAISLGQDAPPGTVWAYNNSAVQVLSAVLQASTGTHPSELAEEWILEPVGMADSELKSDASGGALTFMGLSSTCADLARMGHLMLNEGQWDGEQVVDEEHFEALITSSSDLNAAYGRLWWLNREGPLVGTGLATTGQGSQEPTVGQLLPSAPESTFWALGFNDQVLAVLPEAGVVAVRLGPKPPAEAPFGYRELTEGVLDALQGS